MNWQNFQNKAFDLTQEEINALARQTMQYYTEARKAVENELQALYLKYLSGVKPEDYYNAVIKRNVLSNTLARITAEYQAFSKKAGLNIEKSSSLAMTNTYYRKLYATQWLAPDYLFGFIPESLVELSVYSTESAWKKIPERIIQQYGSLSAYTSKAGTLTKFLLENRSKEVKAIQQAITVGLQQGQSYTALSGSIKEIIGRDLMKDGVYTVTGAKANAMRIIRTEGNRLMNAGGFANAQAAVDQGVDLKRRLIAVLDNRTRAQSANMDGQTVDYDKPFKYPGNVTAFYPGQTGVPKYDINDRETVIDIIGDDVPKLRSGRNPENGKNETFEYKDFNEWAEDNNLTRNIYGEYVRKK